jgi:hypothetical protein
LSITPTPGSSAALGGISISSGANSTQDSLHIVNAGSGDDIEAGNGAFKVSSAGAVVLGTLTGAVVTRANLVQQDLTLHPILLRDLRVWDAVTTLAPATAGNDDLAITTGTFLSAAPVVQGSDAKASTKTQYTRFAYALPDNYVSGETVTLRINAGMITTISDGTATVDVECPKTSAPTSDLCATAAQTINSLVAANKDFTITPTALVAGDILDVRITIAVTDSATQTAVIGQINSITFLLDIKG